MRRKTKLILIVIALVIFSGLWLQSTAWFREKLGNYYFCRGEYTQAIRVYGRLLRKQHIEQLSNPAVKISKKNTDKKDEIEDKLIKAYKKSVRSSFKKASFYYKNDEFKKALDEYAKVIKISSKIYPFLEEDIFRMFGITKRVISTTNKDIIYRIYALAQAVGDQDLSKIKGVNLLRNSMFLDQNKDKCPDQYLCNFYRKSQKEGFYDMEVVFLDKNYNLFHARGKDGNGQLFSSFRLGKIPPNTYFCFSIEIKENNIQGDTEVLLNTYTDVSKRDMAGLDSRRSFKKQGLKKGWQKKTFIMKTDNLDNIYFDRLFVGWNYGNKKGEVFIRKPKLEFGQNCSKWSSYLN